jgi:hypothetical protein
MLEHNLSKIYSDPAVKAFGKALRIALGFDQDYASLIELENVETPEDMAEAIRKFLRRYKRGAKPSETDLESLMRLADSPAAVRILRAALVSYGLVQWDKEDKEKAEVSEPMAVEVSDE